MLQLHHHEDSTTLLKAICDGNVLKLGRVNITDEFVKISDSSIRRLAKDVYSWLGQTYEVRARVADINNVPIKGVRVYASIDSYGISDVKMNPYLEGALNNPYKMIMNHLSPETDEKGEVTWPITFTDDGYPGKYTIRIRADGGAAEYHEVYVCSVFTDVDVQVTDENAYKLNMFDISYQSWQYDPLTCGVAIKTSLKVDDVNGHPISCMHWQSC